MDVYPRKTKPIMIAFISLLLTMLAYYVYYTQIQYTACIRMSASRATFVSPVMYKLPVDRTKHIPNILETDKLTVIDYQRMPLDKTIVCVPLKSAVNSENICIHDIKNDEFISKMLKLHGVWEPHIMATLQLLLGKEPDAQFLDIGANIGVYAMTAASMGRKVIAVEPFWENLLRLSKSVRINLWESRITTIANAVSDIYENVTFWRPPTNPGGSISTSLGIAVDKSLYDGPIGSVGTIQMDNLLEVIDFKKAIMKIDIEGYETKAVRGASRLFDQIEMKYVFMEWGGKGGDQNLNQPLIRFFTSRGYVAHSVQLVLLPGNHDWSYAKEWPFDIIWVQRYK